MKWTTALLMLMAVTSEAYGAKEPAYNLADLRWNYRVILVFAPEPLAGAAVGNLEQYRAEIDDRDIAWFVLTEDSLRSNFPKRLDDGLHAQLTARYFSPEPKETAVVLIGKDGAVKSRTSDLDLEATFGLIDQMPMRLEEMRSKAPIE
ncbi:MAG: DUF4174 domain-containing protein [Lysobacterales bacterium]|jgi:hypothetical protein